MIRKYLTQQQYDDLDGKLNSNVDYVIVENGSPINVTFVTNNITGLDEMYDFAPTPEGTYNITENGEYDVTAYANAYVDVPTPEGSYNITDNGEYDVTAYANAIVNVSDGWEEKYNSLFNNNIKYLNNTYIPIGSTSLGYGLCFGNSYLLSVDLTRVKNIDDYSFYYCPNLTSVNLPSVTNIGSKSFEKCYNLTSVNLPSIVSIGGQSGDNTFGSCSKLTTVDLGPNVTYIIKGAFTDCNDLTSFTCRATTPPTIGEYIFGYWSKPANLVIYVPAESVDAYKAASGWSEFADKIQAIA